MGGRTHTADDEEDASLQAPYRPPEQQSKGVDKAAHGWLRIPPTSDASNVSAARNYEDKDGPLQAPYRPLSKDRGDHHGVVFPGALAVAGIEEENVTGENGPSSNSSAATSGRAKRAKRSSTANQLCDTTPHLTDEEQPTSSSGPPVSLRLPTGGASIATISTITGAITEASAYSSPRSPSEGDIGTSEGAPFEAQLVPDIDEEIAERVQREVKEALKRVAINAIEVDSKAENTPQILGLSRKRFYWMLAFLLVVVVVAVGVGVNNSQHLRGGQQKLGSGTCGYGNRGNGLCPDGTCCSEYGWCGTSAAHCSGGDGSPTNTPSGTCGDGNRGNGICADGTCCSEYGWCGISAEYCSTSSGTCGGGNRGDGICADGTCCSEFGYCGTTAEHCSGGGGSTPSTPTSGTCGGGNRGDGICADGTCCSEFGYCGTTAEHCSGGGGSTPNTSSSAGTCGRGHRGDGICRNGACCSRLGWCGSSAYHCSGGDGGGGGLSGVASMDINSPAVRLTVAQVQAGVRVKGDSTSFTTQAIVDLINQVTSGYSLYRQIAFVAHTIWESGSYQYREEIAKDANREAYQDCDWNTAGTQLPTNGKYFYGRGFMQLSWCANYKAYGAARMYIGDPDLFYNRPELVAIDPYAMDSAVWFYESIVTDTSGQFGRTTNAIKGDLECANSAGHDTARKRYEVFVAIASAVGMTGYSESGCYN